MDFSGDVVEILGVELRRPIALVTAVGFCNKAGERDYIRTVGAEIVSGGTREL